MESIPTHEILQYNPNTLFEIRKLYNLDKPGQMDEVIDLLADWVKKHEYILKKDYSREYFERAIILHKGSVERTKSYIEKLCTFKTLLLHFFDKFDAKKDFDYFKSTCSIVALPKLTADNYRVILLKQWNNEFTTNTLFDFFKFGILLCEYLSSNDYAVGGIAIFDQRNVSISNLLSALNMVYMSQMIAICTKGYAFRLKEIHFISTSKSVELLVKTVKKMFPKKISERIFAHTNIESLYEHIPKEILPAELNGNERCLGGLFDEWLDLLGTKENVEYIKEMYTEAVVDKSYNFAESHEIYGGLNGTFRTLCVD